MIYLITGNGGGKTTQSLGIALRAAGHNKKVIIIQFMKGRVTGEVKALNRLKPYVVLKQFGRKGFVNLKKPSKADKRLAVMALDFALQSLKEKPFMIVLDEACLAAAIGLISVDELLALLKKAGKTHIIMTGRRAPKELKDAADIVSESTDLKRNLMPSKKGIEY